MLVKKFSHRGKPIIGFLVVFGLAYLFLNSSLLFSQEKLMSNILVTKVRASELMDSPPVLTAHWTCSNWGDPWGSQTSTFYTTDHIAIEFTEWNTTACTREWQADILFYDPDRNVYEPESVTLPRGESSYIFKSGILIDGHYPAEHPGGWSAAILLEGEWQAEDYFRIISSTQYPELINNWTYSDRNDPWGSQTTLFSTEDDSVYQFTEWNTMGCTQTYMVSINFYKGGTWIHGASGDAPAGESSWILKGSMPIKGEYAGSHPGSDWHVDMIGPEGFIASNDFTIEGEPPRISVDSPNGGEIWYVGSTEYIEWGSNNTSGSVEIEYSTNGGSIWTTVVSSTPDDGSYRWIIPDEPSDRCFVRITDVDGDPSDESDNYFSIRKRPENIKVTSPNGIEVWQVGTSHTITWTSQNTSGNVKIEYSIDGGINWINIIASTPDDGSLLWTIPNTPSTNCLVRITDVDEYPSDWSDEPFTIKGEEYITVTSPNGGEIWKIGTSKTITWTSSGTSGNVKVEYSTNSGATWSIIVASTPNDGSHSWTIPNTPSTSCYVRITDVDGTPSDMSDGPFTITPRPEWIVPITISGGGKNYVRTFGGDASATDGFDLGLDVDTAPPGMTYYAYFEIAQFPNYLDTDIREWISPYNTDIDWTLKIVNAPGITSTLSWNPTDVPTGPNIRPFTLVGPALNVDMGIQGSAQVNGDATITIQYGGVIVTYNFPQQGWYLISLPLFPDNNNLNVLFPTALSAFAYNPTTMSYYSVTSLEPKKGYWLSIPGPTTSTIIGVPLNSYKEYYNTGWHLIGTVMGVTNFTDPNDDPNGAVISTYGWNPGASTYYQAYPPGTGVLNEKEGYWLAVAKSCDLIIGGSALSKDAVASEADMEVFYQRFGAQPPVPPFVADYSLAPSLSTENVSSRAYPNPFNLETMIEYWLPQPAFTNVYIYNSMGQRIRTLVESQQSQGKHHVLWDGRNDNGEIVTNGIYFYRIIAPEFAETQKILLLK